MVCAWQHAIENFPDSLSVPWPAAAKRPMVGSVGLAVISWLELCSNQVKTFDLILEVSSVSSAGLMHVAPLPHSNTKLVGFRICIRHFNRGFHNPHLFGDYDLAWYSQELRAFGASTPQPTAMLEQVWSFYVIDEAMINKSRHLANQCFSSSNL